MDTNQASGHASQQTRSYQTVTSRWAAIPSSYGARKRSEHDNEQQKLPSPAEHGWRLRPTVAGHAISGPSLDAPAPSRPRRRPRELRDLPARTTLESDVDYALLYPQMSPYSTEFGMRSAPDKMQHVAPRSLSQPHSASYFPQTYDPYDPQPGQLPRSPTYPPTGRRRMHSDSGAQDGAFADEVEFRLFVDATAGLGPEQAFRPTIHPPTRHTVRRNHSWEANNDQISPISSPEARVSPLEETPTTLRALQHLAQMPQASQEPRRSPTLRAFQQLAQLPQASNEFPRQRTHTPASGVHLWLASSHDPTGLENGNFENGEDLPDDELPDYASSQAQAQNSQRIEAARRAQELQRRWQSSYSTFGR